MIGKIRYKWNNTHPFFKTIIVIWLGCMTAILFSFLLSKINLDNDESVKMKEYRYIEIVKNIGFPDKQPNLVEFDMQKFIGGKRILVNKFTYTLSQEAVLKYYDIAFVKNGWEKIPTTDGKIRYIKEDMEYMIRFLPNSVYEVRVSMINQK